MSDFDFSADFFDEGMEMSLDEVEAVGRKQITKEAATILREFVVWCLANAPHNRDSEGNELETHVGVPIVWNRLPRKVREAFEPERKDQRVTGGFQSVLRYIRSWQDDLNVFPKSIADDKVIHSLLVKTSTPLDKIERDHPDFKNDYTVEMKDKDGTVYRDRVLTDLSVSDPDENLLYGGFVLLHKNEWVAKIEAKKASKKSKNTSEDTTTDENEAESDDSTENDE